MGKIVNPPRVILLCALVYKGKSKREKICQILEDKYGKIEKCIGPLNFDSFTDYYTAEMGTGLKKEFFVFENRFDREMLPRVKLFTNDIEKRFSHKGGRLVNIDPGYISRDKVVLASTKDFFHRLYLSDGIYGETTLHYRRGMYRYFSWTYPDYRDRNVQKFLEGARAELVGEIRRAGKE